MLYTIYIIYYIYLYMHNYTLTVSDEHGCLEVIFWLCDYFFDCFACFGCIKSQGNALVLYLLCALLGGW